MLRRRQFGTRWFLVWLLASACLGSWLPTQSLAAAASSPDGTVHITILGTTDLHGHIDPVDYFANRPAELGLAKIATLIRDVRSQEKNVLLLDSGDTIQGTPLAYYFARKDPTSPDPMMLCMNALAYDAAAVGNHEFNFGLKKLWKMKSEARFPILAANVRQSYPRGTQYFQPYIIKKIAGVRVGIVGFVTPGIPHWELPANYRGYTFESIVAAARRIIPEVRRQADVVVVLAHSGLGPEAGVKPWADEVPGENQILELAQQVPGIDVILLGHTHQELGERTVNGVLLTQAKNWGASLARIDLTLLPADRNRWRVVSKHSRVLPVSAKVPADPEIVKLAAPYESATEAYLDTPVAHSAKAMSGATARFEEEPLVDVIHTVQLEQGHADVSLATMLYTGVRIPAGPVTIRQLAALYVYENYLYVVEMNGAQLRTALEHAAGMYMHWPLAAGEQVTLPDYSLDSAAGVSYTIDLRKPSGSRIVDLAYKGKPLEDSQGLRVAINNYRYTGGGRYEVFKDLPILYRSPVEIRELIIEHLTRTGELPAVTKYDWHVEPKEAVDALRAVALERPDHPRSSLAPNLFLYPVKVSAASPPH